MTPPQVGSSPSCSAVTPVVATSTTVPANPSSATTTLLPPASTRTGSPCSSARRTASTRSASVGARTQVRAGPPSRRVVWSLSRSLRTSATQDHRGVAEHGVLAAGDGQPDRAVVAPLAGDAHLGAGLRHHHGLGELGGDLTDAAGLAELLVDVAGRESHGEHAVGDHVGQPDTAGDLGVLVD